MADESYDLSRLLGADGVFNPNKSDPLAPGSDGSPHGLPGADTLAAMFGQGPGGAAGSAIGRMVGQGLGMPNPSAPVLGSDKLRDLGYPDPGGPAPEDATHPLDFGTDAFGLPHPDKLVEDFKRRLDETSVFSTQSPGQLYVGDTFAKNYLDYGLTDQYNKDYSSGTTSDEIDKKQTDETTLQMVMDAANKTSHLDNTQFRQYLQQLVNAVENQVTLPHRSGMPTPSIWTTLLTALAAKAAPRYAFDIGAQPAVWAQKEQDQAYHDEVLRYQRDREAQANKVKVYGELAGLQNQRDIQDQNSQDSAIQRTWTTLEGAKGRELQRELAQDKAGQALDRQQLIDAQKEVDANWKAFNEGKSFEIRDNARQWLQLHGRNPGPTAPETPQEYQMRAHGNYYGVRGENETKLADARAWQLQTLAGVNQARAAKLAKETSWMDSDKAVAHAKAYAAIDNVRNMISSRDVRSQQGWQRLAQDAWGKSQSTINQGMRSLSTQADTIRHNLGEIEKKFYGTTWMTDASGKITDPRYQPMKDQLDQYRGELNQLGTASNDLKTEAAGVRKQLQGMGVNPNAGNPDKGSRGRSAGTDYQGLTSYAEQNGFHVTSGLASSGHNAGSPHYYGLAVDVRTRDKSDSEIDAFIKQAKADGIKVRDERTHPAGQKVWSGPHLHLEYASAGSPAKAQPKTGKTRTYGGFEYGG